MKIKSNRKKRFAILRLSAIIFALLSLIGLYIGGTKQTYADGVTLSESDVRAYEQNIFYKVEYNNLKRCYSQLPQRIDNTQVYKKLADALLDIELNYPVFIYGPDYWKDDYHKNCKKLLGDQTFSNFTDNSGYTPYSDATTDNSRRSGKKCFYISARLNNDKHDTWVYSTGDYCVEIDSDGNIKESTIEYLSSIKDGGSLVNDVYAFHLKTSSGSTGKVSIPTIKNGQLCFNINYLKAGDTKWTKYDTSLLFDDKESVQCKTLPMSYDSFKDFISNIIKNSKVNDGSDKKVFDVNTIVITDSSSTKAAKAYTKASADDFANKFLKLTKNIDIKNGTFSNAEKYLIYRNALKSDSYYKVSVDYNNNGSKPVSWLTDDFTFRDNVYLNPTNNPSRKPFVPYSDSVGRSRTANGTSYDWSDYVLGDTGIIEEMSKINVAEAFKEKPTASIDPDSGSNDGSNSESDVCYSAGGALSWILCPIINAAHFAIDGIYNTLEGWIRINSGIVEKLGSTDDSDDNSLFKAWSTFRNIANIAFVILFMAIIFSQLTGYGIDNYGIKRMLPKLIITAILVNLSYIICGLLVDISNIVGNSVKGLFEGMAVNKGILGDTSINAPSALVRAILGVGVGAGAIGVFVLSGANFLPIVLFVVTMLIGALTILIILGMRQALVIVLIMASPLAMVCMILPNTEGIYKKWKDAFKGMLIVYPIISAVIGASYFAASIIATTENGGITAIIAGILMIAPYFMIPSLTRKSIDAIGNIGSRISSFGQRGSSRAQNGVRSSNLGKSMQQNADFRKAKRYMEGGYFRKKFGKDSRGKKLADKINAGKKVSIRSANKYQQMANLASAREQANIGARTAQSKYSRLQNTGYDASLSAAASAEEDAAIKDYETQIRNGDFKAAFMKEGKNKDGKIEKKLITDRAPEGDNELAAALEYELKLGNAADKNKIIALQNVLSKTDGGRNAMVESINSALREPGKVSSTSVKAIASNIMANQGDYKGVHRSIYEWAKYVLNDGNRKDNTTEVDMSKITGIDRTGGIQALTPSSFLSTDKTQMEQYLKFYESGNAKIKAIREQVENGTLGEEEANKQIEAIKSDPDRIRLEEAAHSIAYNPNLHGSIRWDDYRVALETFASDIDWSSVRSGRGVDVRISHDDGTQSVSVQTQQISQPEPTQPEPTQPTQAQPQPVFQQTSQPQPQQSQQSTPTQPQPAPQQTSQPQQQQKTDYTERLKEEIIQRSMNSEFSAETGEKMLKMVENSNNQKPNNS